MNDIGELDELQGYRREIFDGINRNLHDGVTKLNDTLSMLCDYQEICTALFALTDRQAQQIEEQQQEIVEKTKYINEFEKKNARYAKMEIDALEMVSLLRLYEDKLKNLESEEAQLTAEKEAFEEVRKGMENEVWESRNQVKLLKEARDEAYVSRDKAIKAKREAENALRDKEREILELKEERDEYRRQIESLQEEQEDPSPEAEEDIPAEHGETELPTSSQNDFYFVPKE